MGKRRGEKDEPNLELPSFFRRRDRRAADSEPADEPARSEGLESAEEPQEPESEAVIERAEPPTPEPDEPHQYPEPQDPEATRHLDPVLDATMPGMASAEVTVHHPDEATDSAEPAVDHEATEQAGYDEPATAEAPVDTAPPVVPAESAAVTPPAEPAAASHAESGRRAARARRTTPSIHPRLAAGLVGLLVGAAGTLLTWGALAGCEVLRGTDSCGGPGLLVLVAILVLMVVSGALLLKAVKVAEAGATSFLGTGLMTVVVMVALLEAVFSRWMFVVVPLLTSASFVAAWWVSTRFVETEEDQPTVDVR